MTGLPADWTPVSNPPPPDDEHTWAMPASPPCPHCPCCSALLCQRAIVRSSTCDATDHTGCDAADHTGADFDLYQCPCWRVGSQARAAALEIARAGGLS